MSTTQAKLARLIETKNNIRQKIISLGVDVPINTPFRDYPSLIEQLGGTEFLETTTDQDLLRLLDLYRWLGSAEYMDYVYAEEEIQSVHNLLDTINNGEPEQTINNLPVLIITSFGETHYYTGEKFSLDGYTVMLMHPDGTKVDVTEDCIISSANEFAINDKYVIISYIVDDLELTVKQPVNIELAPNYIEYLESTGTQYIDIGIAMNTDIAIEIDFAMTTVMGGCGIVGGWGDPSNSGALLGVNNSKFQFAYGSTWNGSTKTQDTNRHKAYINLNGQCLIDDTVLATTSNITASLNGNKTIRLFTTNGGTSTNAKMRLYETKIYRSDKLIMHLLPAINPMGIYCLFDKVTKTYHVNAGTGTFISADYVPQQLEYIESNGTSYIDTLYVPSNKTNIVLDYEYISGNSGSYIPVGIHRYTNGSKMFGIWVNADSKNVAIIYGSYDTASIENTNGSGRHTYSNNGGKFYMDGNMIADINVSSFTCSGSLPIFALKTANSTYDTRGSRGRLYSLEIYESGVLVRDFRPAIDVNGTYCLYEAVSKTYIVGAGTFIGGPVKAG